MKLHRFDLAAILPFLFAASLAASSFHTWVAATGNDSTGTGTTANPYATFRVAVANTAAGGIVSVMGPGDYGRVEITQSITIDGTGGGSITYNLSGGSAPVGISINPSSNASIVIRNLTIDLGGTSTTGITIDSASTANTVTVLIDGCLIAGFEGAGVLLGTESPMYVTIKNTTIQGGNSGVDAGANPTGITIEDHVSLEHVSVQGSQTGVDTSNGNVDISNSNITGNEIGVEAGGNATLNVQSTMITSNTYGACIKTNSAAIIGTSAVVADNTTNIEACGGSVQGSAGAGPSPKL
jgi:hypothetical protein